MKLHVDLKENGYDIIMEHGILYRLNDHIDLNRKVMIVTDSGVPEAYANIVREQMQKGYIHVIEQGEDSKDLSIFKESMKICSHINFQERIVLSLLEAVLSAILQDMWQPPICVVLILFRYQQQHYLKSTPASAARLQSIWMRSRTSVGAFISRKLFLSIRKHYRRFPKDIILTD